MAGSTAQQVFQLMNQELRIPEVPAERKMDTTKVTDTWMLEEWEKFRLTVYRLYTADHLFYKVVASSLSFRMTHSVDKNDSEPQETVCRQSTQLSPNQTFSAELLAQGACIDRVVNANIPLESVLVKKSYFAVQVAGEKAGDEPLMEK